MQDPISDLPLEIPEEDVNLEVSLHVDNNLPSLKVNVNETRHIGKNI